MKDRTKVIDRLHRQLRESIIRMPFERGAPRRAMIARRAAASMAEPMRLASSGQH